MKKLEESSNKEELIRLLSDIPKLDFKKNGIREIQYICSKNCTPRLVIIHCNDEGYTIDNEEEMIKFLKNLK